jgi:predicted Zn-dependent protease
MNQLAPRDQQGYAPAHLWIAAQILKAGTLTRESYDLAFAHLMRARQEPAQANLVDATLAELYLVSGRVEQARELLIRLPNLTGQQQLSLARTSALTGKVDNARREAAAAANMFAAQVKDEPNNSEARMHWAEACALSGQTEQAEVILRDGVAMSPKGPCSVALVRFYLQWVEMLARTPSPQNSRQILQILRRARTVAESLPSDNVAAMSLLAQINLQLNEPDKAEEYLKRAAPSDLASQVKYASLLGLRGKKEESVIQARQALQRGTLQLKENPSNAMVIAMTAEAAGILGDFAQSAALLEEGVKQLQNNQFDALLSRAYLAMYDKQRAAGGEASESIKLLRKSFERNPWDAAVLQRVLAVMKEKSSAGEQARAMVNERLAAGGVPGIAHMLIGTDALQAGDAESARKHLELAFQLEPRIGSIANNLAWTLLKSEPPDLSRALELVSQALKLTPNSPDCYDTRANIYMAMERWEDAVKDFEVVLRARPSDAKLHRSLAEAYRKLHMDDLAKRHDDAAVALEAGK